MLRLPTLAVPWRDRNLGDFTGRVKTQPPNQCLVEDSPPYQGPSFGDDGPTSCPLVLLRRLVPLCPKDAPSCSALTGSVALDLELIS